MPVLTFKGRVTSTANGQVDFTFDDTQSGAGPTERLNRANILSIYDSLASVSQGAYLWSTSGGTTSQGYVTFTISQ